MCYFTLAQAALIDPPVGNALVNMDDHIYQMIQQPDAVGIAADDWLPSADYVWTYPSSGNPLLGTFSRVITAEDSSDNADIL